MRIPVRFRRAAAAAAVAGVAVASARTSHVRPGAAEAKAAAVAAAAANRRMLEELEIYEFSAEDAAGFADAGHFGAAAPRELHKGGKHGKGEYMAAAAAPAPVVPLPPQQVIVPVAVPVPMLPEVRQEMGCPSGYDLRAGRCVANELVAPDMSCPPETQFFDGQCAQFARGMRDCPDGYRVSGGRCIATEIVPAEYTCADGGELDETGAACRVFHAQGAQCPAGFRLDHGSEMCVQQFPAQVACPAGHSMSKHGCVKEVGVEASPMCPAGSELDAGGKNKCFTIAPGKSKCPHGFKMSHDTGRCVKKAKKVLAACPEGFTEYAGHKAICERLSSVPPQLTCPPGSALDAATGQCQAETLAAATCPDGYANSRSHAHVCERVVEEVGRCPQGTVAIGFGAGLTCQASVEHEIIECCPPGFDMFNGRCERHEVFAAVPKCQGDCARVRAAPPVLRCPLDFELDGRRCVRRLAHPCAAAALTDECSPYMMQYAASYSPAGHSLRDGGREAQVQMPASCARVMHEVCHSEEAQPADLVCPEGDFDGTHCVIRDFMASEPVCKFGVMDAATGQCVKVSTVPLKTECPAGTTRIGRRCVEYEEHPPEFVCPDGATADGRGNCVLRAPILATGLAEVSRTPPIPVCPSGTLQGALCYDTERVPRQFVCPEGATPAGKHMKDASVVIEAAADVGKYCLVIADMVVPPPVKKWVKPKYYCGDGKLAKGKHCHSHHKEEPLVSCPQGSVMEGQLCVRRLPAVVGGSRVTSAPAVPICPPGTTVQGAKCVATRETPSDLRCPPGFIAQPNRNVEKECARFTEMVAVCPAGTLHTAEGCLRERSIAPVVATIPVVPCNEPHCA